MSKQVKKPDKKTGKYLIAILLNFSWMFALYRAMIMLGEHVRSLLPYAICSSLYLAAGAILLGIYYFCTKGETDVSKKERYKPLFVWAFPIVLVLLLDVLETILLDNIINMFS